jgi:ribonuclease D
MTSNRMIAANQILVPKLCRKDIPQHLFDMFSQADAIAWDIETSGLDWRTERIATCQLYVWGSVPIIIRIEDNRPERLKSLLENRLIKKIFHHAMFDLRFMAHAWGARPQNVACTKIAAKLIDRDQAESHSLKDLVQRYLGVSIDKTEQTSDWLSARLTAGQIQYAASDVLHLPALLHEIQQRLESQQLVSLASECFAHIPTRVQLDIMGYPDIYTY